ncbi:DUF3426 domain-containing protein [Agitococcus lubricus]|uniref:Putative Zn finger-like uncharacterized protein n=1 Tax=Agitococcus lubricus TaxID=1077255 RepID=A0A2T5J2M8_9GAMM|nr:DUF3426 domain-containing protein [Agitococcus lubricus]PTQ90783.1 putative Zn finger-like uncharacterized protein [Agitococcus lubricus]
MSTTKQTRCPHCSSVFNITDDQLAARGGHVRCGGCLQVFRADQNLVTESVIQSVPASPMAPSAPATARVPTPTPSPIETASPSKKPKVKDDSWVTNLLDDDINLDDLALDTPPVPVPKKSAIANTPPPTPAKASKKPLFDDELSDLLHEAWVEPAEKDHLKGIGEVDKIKASADESWAQALISELEEEEKKEQSKNYSMELQPTKPKEPARKASPVAENKTSSTAKVDNQATLNKDDDLLSFLNSNSAPVINQRHASLPVEVRQHTMVSVNWSYWLTWSTLCLLGVLMLISQYIYFNFNHLAIADQTRPQITQLCNILGCKVPEPPNIKLIAINKLSVRPHPEVTNALEVNAIIYNKADFAQPLPALKLMFLDKKSKVTASRAFQPKEYLRGEGSNLRRIPPETPIHIRLEIIKPEAELRNYKMQPLY